MTQPTVFEHFMFFVSFFNLCVGATPVPPTPAGCFTGIHVSPNTGASPPDCGAAIPGKPIAEGTLCFCGSFCSPTLVRGGVGEDEDKNWEAGVHKLLEVPDQIGGQWNIFGQKLTFKTIYKADFLHP